MIEVAMKSLNPKHWPFLAECSSFVSAACTDCLRVRVCSLAYVAMQPKGNFAVQLSELRADCVLEQ